MSLFIAQLAIDLLHPSLDIERKQHKKKRLVQNPNSYFMDVKCPGKDSADEQTDFIISRLPVHEIYAIYDVCSRLCSRYNINIVFP